MKETIAAARTIIEAKCTSRLCLLSLGGSHAYGLNTPESDVDIRGFAMPTAHDILIGKDFEQIRGKDGLDMCVYSLAKACRLIAQCNPSIVELLGLDEDVVIISSKEYREIRAHPEWFLSKHAADTFGGYATLQLRRLQNAMDRDKDARQLAEAEMRSIEAAIETLPDSYPMLKGKVRMSLDNLDTNDERICIMVQVNTGRVPATELATFARQLDSARKSAETIGKNRRKESSKLAKHASHLIRLLHMGAEILRGEGVKTRRVEDAQLLRDLKAGMWLETDSLGRRTYADEFWQLLDEAESAFQEAKANTVLPDEPNHAAIDDFVADCHRRCVMADAEKTDAQ